MTTPTIRSLPDKKTKVYRTPLALKVSKQMQMALNNPTLKTISLYNTTPNLQQQKWKPNKTSTLKKSFEVQSADDFDEFSDNDGDYDSFSLGPEISHAPPILKSPQKSCQPLSQPTRRTGSFLEHSCSFMVLLIYILVINTVIRGYFTSSWVVWPF